MISHSTIYPKFLARLILLVSLLGAHSAYAAVVYSPTKSRLNIWEPFYYDADFLGQTGNTVVARILTVSQGYTTVERFQDTFDDLNPDGCPRAAWDTFAVSAGVALVDSHGGAGEIVAIGFNGRSLGQEKSAAKKWIRSGLKPTGSTMYEEVSPSRNHWQVSVMPDWFATNWFPGFNTNRSIVILAACETATSDLLQKIGGRSRFGYSACISGVTIREDLVKLFDRMNGTKGISGPGTSRKAEIAYDFRTGYSNSFTLLENAGTTTLCPSVEHPNEDQELIDLLKPYDRYAGLKGSGYVTFDTHCDNTKPADQVLTATPSGTARVFNIKWVDDYKITFDYEATEGYTVTMKVNQSLLLAEGGAPLHLDGGSVDQDGEGEYGVAPNEDDFTWTFSQE